MTISEIMRGSIVLSSRNNFCYYDSTSVSCSVMSDSFATLWTVAHQVLLSMEFSRQHYSSEFPYPPPGNLPSTGIKPRSPTLQILYCLSHQGRSNIWNIAVQFVCVELLLVIPMVSLNFHINFKIIYEIQRILDFTTSEMG